MHDFLANHLMTSSIIIFTVAYIAGILTAANIAV